MDLVERETRTTTSVGIGVDVTHLLGRSHFNRHCDNSILCFVEMKKTAGLLESEEDGLTSINWAWRDVQKVLAGEWETRVMMEEIAPFVAF